MRQKRLTTLYKRIEFTCKGINTMITVEGKFFVKLQNLISYKWFIIRPALLITPFCYNQTQCGTQKQVIEKIKKNLLIDLAPQPISKSQ